MSTLKQALYISVAVLVAGSAHAAGFQLKEQSASLQGLSFAGATAKSDDLSTLFYNPAGMMRLDSKYGISVGGSYIRPRATFSPESVTPASGVLGGTTTEPNMGNILGGDAGTGAVVPNAYAMAEIAPDWRVGVSVNVPFGLATEYKDEWMGRYYAIDSEVETINITPSIAHRISNQFSIGAGIQAQYIKARLTNAVNIDAFPGPPTTTDAEAKVKGDDWAFGYTVGVLWEPRTDTRVGLDYRSRIHHELEGELTITGVPGFLAGVPALASADATAKTTTPDILSLGVSHDLDDRLTLLGEVSWTNWSLFKDLNVIERDTGVVRQSIDENWHDTIFLAAGAEYKYNEKWKFRGGVAFDRAAVGDANRTFRIPETNRYWVSAGFGYQITDSVTLDVGYSHLFADDADVSEEAAAATSGIVTGNFDSQVDIITTGVSWKF